MAAMMDFRELVGASINAHTVCADPLPDRKVTLGALAFSDTLGRLLWRMKYGQDVKRAGLARAAWLLSDHLRHAHRFDPSRAKRLRKLPHSDNSETGAAQGDVIDRLACRALVEWINDRCPQCRGRGTIGQAACAVGVSRGTPTGRRKPRPASPACQLCPTCRGSEKRRVDHPARARALGLSLDQYQRHWERRFDFALAALDRVDGLVADQLKRRHRP
ncbi:MAG: hypothetical protein ACRYHA_07435 [Janthinobacterium lividum]